MKCEIILGTEREDCVLIYARKKTPLVEEIERLAREGDEPLIGHADGSTCRLTPSEIYCVLVEDNKVYALTKTDRWQLRKRLYQMEESLGDTFVKINQSCLVNIRQIERFDASFSASLMVTLKNGYRDYVSRRQLKFVKERIGFYL